MKIRIHTGGLAESIRTVATIEPTKEAIAQYLRDRWGGLGYDIYSENIRVEPYGFDKRIGWDTYIVLLDGHASAFTNGPLS
jgi:hypothetical protein